MAHELATNALGQNMFAYNGEDPWHRLGQKASDAMTVHEALKLSHTDWEVVKRPLFFGATDESKMGTGAVHNAFATVRIDPDTGDETYLGTVGHRYTIIQNERLFSFLDELTGQNGQARFETAGALKGGRMVFVSMLLPENITLDPGGRADVVKPFFMGVNTHDGSGSAYTCVTPVRPVCANTVSWATRQAVSRWSVRHTSGALDRIAEARRTLRLTVDYYKAFEADATKMIQTPMSDAEFDRFLEQWHPLGDDASKLTAKRVETKRDKARDLFRNSPTNANIRNTVWGAEQALIEQMDWHAAVRAPKSLTEDIARSTRVIEGKDNEDKSKLHQRLLTLASR